MVTIFAEGLDALGTYRPPATGDAKCRWGEWNAFTDPPDTVYRAYHVPVERGQSQLAWEAGQAWSI